MILKQYGDEVSLGESMYFGFRYSSGVTSSIGCRGEETAACRPFFWLWMISTVPLVQWSSHTASRPGVSRVETGNHDQMTALDLEIRGRQSI